MALFYRSDLFEQNGIAVPTTWEEYKSAAEQIRALGGYITNFSQSDINQFAGFVWQAGGEWFTNDGEEWTVDLTERRLGHGRRLLAGPHRQRPRRHLPAVDRRVEQRLQLRRGLDVELCGLGCELDRERCSRHGRQLVGRALPAVGGGRQSAAGNWGGSSIAVFKGTDHLYEAAKFALWLNTSEEALTSLNETAAIYPATKAGLELPVAAGGRRVLRRSEDLRRLRRGRRPGQPRLRVGPDHDADLRRRVRRLQGRRRRRRDAGRRAGGRSAERRSRLSRRSRSRSRSSLLE